MLVSLFVIFFSISAQAQLEPNFKNPAMLTGSINTILGREFRGHDATEFNQQLIKMSLEMKQQGIMVSPKEYKLSYLVDKESSLATILGYENDQQRAIALEFFQFELQKLSSYHQIENSPKEGAGTLTELIKLTEEAHLKLQSDLETSTDDAERERLEQEIAEIEKAKKELSELVETGVSQTVQNIEELSIDLEKLSTEVGNSDGNHSVKQIIFLKETLFSESSIEERINLIDNPHGPYYQLSTEEKEKLKSTLQKQQKIEKGLNSMSDALVAAQDTTHLLNKLGLIDDSKTQEIEKGLVITGDALQIATALSTGNIFMAISGVSNLFSHILGEEPKPDPDQVRHEQVMSALNQLQNGQIKILKSIAQLSKQINSQFEVLYSLIKDVKDITKTSMDLLVEGKLKGLRDCEQFLDSRKYFSDENGFLNYRSFSSHFFTNKSIYFSCVDFINDQIRGEGLNLLSMATNEEEAREIEKRLKRPAGWVKTKIDKESNRVQDLENFMQLTIKPKYHKALLGSLSEPAYSFTDVTKKLKAISSDESVRSYYEKIYYDILGTTELKKFYNPNLVTRIASVSAELLDHKLLKSPYTDNIYQLEDVVSDEFSPLDNFGGTFELAMENFLLPVKQSIDLLSRSIAQNTLYSGDVLTPFLSIFAIKQSLIPYRNRAYRPLFPRLTYAAQFLLGKNPIMYDNVVRYSINLAFHKISDQEILATIEEFLLDDVAENLKNHMNRERFYNESFWRNYANFFLPLTQQNIEMADHRYSAVSDIIQNYFDWYEVRTHAELNSTFSNPSLNAIFTVSSQFTKDPNRQSTEKQLVVGRLPTLRELREKRLSLSDDIINLGHLRHQLRKIMQEKMTELKLQNDLKTRRAFLLKMLLL